MLCVGLVILIGVFVSGIYLFNTIFPKAGPISIPQAEDVVSVSISYSNSDQTVLLHEEDMEQLLQYLMESAPTRQRAINDYPTERTYYGISVQTDVREYRYFIYEKTANQGSYWINARVGSFFYLWWFLIFINSVLKISCETWMRRGSLVTLF